MDEKISSKKSLDLLLAGHKDIKDIFSALKDSIVEFNGSTDILKHQVCITSVF